ncbi:MAG: hypothetical protein AVDCRST_MAG91-3637, partial [uncultured Sphingomonadaceae bacterium]
GRRCRLRNFGRSCCRLDRRDLFEPGFRRALLRGRCAGQGRRQRHRKLGAARSFLPGL